MNGWLKISACALAVLPALSMSNGASAQTYNLRTDVPSYGVPNANPQRWENSPQNWNNSPENWQNNPQNWQNSPQNWANNPQNWQNNPDNYDGTRGIYDKDGNRLGYAVPRADGSGVNFFDNSGKPTGSQLYEQKNQNQ
jgi:hypothetical protein